MATWRLTFTIALDPNEYCEQYLLGKKPAIFGWFFVLKKIVGLESIFFPSPRRRGSKGEVSAIK